MNLKSESGARLPVPEGATVNVEVSAALLAATARDVDPDSVHVLVANGLTRPRRTVCVADVWEARLPETACDWLGFLLPDDTANPQPVAFELTADGQAVADWLQAIGATEGVEGLDDG